MLSYNALSSHVCTTPRRTPGPSPLSEDQVKITSLGHLGITQKEKDRNNLKQENPLTGLTYETLGKRWDGLQKMMSYTYLSPMDTWDWMLAIWKAGRKRQGWTRFNTDTVVGKGRTEFNSRMQETTLGDKGSSCTCAGAAPDYIRFQIQPRICILANQETNSRNLRLWFWYCWLQLRQ